MDVTFFSDMIKLAGPQIATLLALVAANIILGVAVAIKNRVFEWAKVADFYLSDIVPKLLGYLAIRIIVVFGAVEFLGPSLGASIGDGLLTAIWLAIVVSIGGDILSKVSALGVTSISRIPGVK